jgi:hypothetical protein
MGNYYFFRNLNNYDELLTKTKNAIEKKSLNIKKTNIVSTIYLDKNNFVEFLGDFRRNQKFIYENIPNMKIINSIWNCIEVKCDNNSVLVMSDGYQYPRFVALKDMLSLT